ncbi:uncharacterized protein BJX67DRAFT_379680 [Aspergillus lucknowensis]|uniref:Myb-like DNA-binding domain-containing protein n=1 Tax=Aspergillus lucknowensis TaxID=176173 RepID=A0ABR4LW07_9EURO
MSSSKDSTPTPSVVRRSKTMPTDSPTAKFLYTILKQLDLKGIDWTLVASQLEISNGHAARMRYHRFKNQMEGTTATPRKRAANKSTKTAPSSSKACFQKEVSPPPLETVKSEPFTHGPYESGPYIKTEQYPQQVPSLVNIPQITSHVTPASQSRHSPVSAPVSYRQMTLGPELTMYSPTPIRPPVSMGIDQGRFSPVSWTPVKVEPEELFGKQKAETNPVKEEAAPEDSTMRGE